MLRVHRMHCYLITLFRRNACHQSVTIVRFFVHSIAQMRFIIGCIGVVWVTIRYAIVHRFERCIDVFVVAVVEYGMRKTSIFLLIAFPFEVFGATFFVLPDAIVRAYAELFNIAARIVVVVLDQMTPCILLRLLAGILQFSSPVCEPIANLW